MKRFGWIIGASILVAPAALGQEKSAMQQLLDELHTKGVLPDADYKRMSDTASRENAGGQLQAGYDKGFFLKDKDDLFLLRIAGFGQFRYTYFDRDQDVSRTNPDESSFRIRKMRVKFYGNAFKPWVSYFLQWENAGGSLSLLDYWIDLYDKKNLPEIGLKFGQIKTQFSRQFITSDENTDFTERSIANDVFSFDRDQGAVIHGKPFGNDLNIEYTTGLYNGNGRNQMENPDVGLLWLSRLEWNLLGEAGYVEGDVDDSQDPKWSIASSYGYNVVTPSTGPASTIDQKISRWEADTSFKYMGFAVQGEVFVDSETPDRRAAGVRGIHASGTYLQTGYFLIPKELEVAARYAYVDPDLSATANRQEVTGGVHYYIAGHPWKLQVELRRLTEAREPGIDNRELQFIVQMQVSF